MALNDIAKIGPDHKDFVCTNYAGGLGHEYIAVVDSKEGPRVLCEVNSFEDAEKHGGKESRIYRRHPSGKGWVPLRS